MKDCLFCRIAAGEIPSKKVYSDDLVYAFQDIAPKAPTHVLVIPRKHIGKLADAGPERREILGEVVARAAAIARDLKLEHYRLVANNGEEAGQSRLPPPLPPPRRPSDVLAPGMSRRLPRRLRSSGICRLRRHRRAARPRGSTARLIPPLAAAPAARGSSALRRLPAPRAGLPFGRSESQVGHRDCFVGRRGRGAARGNERMELPALAGAVLSGRRPDEEVARLPRGKTLDGRGQRNLLLPDPPGGLRRLARCGSSGLSVRRQRQPVHHAHAQAPRLPGASGQLLRVRDPAARSAARTGPLAASAATAVRPGPGRRVSLRPAPRTSAARSAGRAGTTAGRPAARR